IFQTRIDGTHPLCYGLAEGEPLPVFRNSRIILEPPGETSAPVVYDDKPLLSGFVSAENLKLLAGSASVAVVPAGKGRAGAPARRRARPVCSPTLLLPGRPPAGRRAPPGGGAPATVWRISPVARHCVADGRKEPRRSRGPLSGQRPRRRVIMVVPDGGLSKFS